MCNGKSTIQIRTNVWDSVQGVIIMNEREDEFREMTNEEYREGLEKIFDRIEDNRLLRYFYIFVSEKLKRVL